MNTNAELKSPLRKFALGRLDAAMHRRHETVREIGYLDEKGVLDDSDFQEYRTQLKLLDWAIYSLYLDCVDAGAEEEARRLLDDLRHAEQRTVDVAR